MVDNLKEVESADHKATSDALERARLARERREAEQRRKLDELHAQAAAAQAQREKRDEERRQRQAEQRARDDERRQGVEERKRAILEATTTRRNALVQRERERNERLERVRAARSTPRSAFAFGSSTPRLLESVDSAGFFWAARRAASTTNVMTASAMHPHNSSTLFGLDNKNKDENERSPQPAWSSVARRRTDLVPTLPASRAPGRAYSMTRLDKLPSQRSLHSASPSMHHLNRTQWRSGETTPGSRPGSAMSSATVTAAGTVVRRNNPRKSRPVSIAGTGVNTPRGGGGDMLSVASTPTVSRDGTLVAGGDARAPPRDSPWAEPPPRAPRRQRPLSVHGTIKLSQTVSPADGKPPVLRKPKPPKDENVNGSKNQVSAIEVTQKLEALQVSGDDVAQSNDSNVSENELNVSYVKTEQKTVKNKIEGVKPLPAEVPPTSEGLKVVPAEFVKPVPVEAPKPEKEAVKSEKKDKEEKREQSQEKTEENEMTASMTARRITTEEEAKAALAERRRKAREELERQAELERQRVQREAEEEAERQRQEEERQRREEEEARELARLQRRLEEDKLNKAIAAQQQLEREEAERKAREESERQARLKEEEEKKRAAEEAERLRKEEAEREEKERLARKQRVEAIMARTRLRKAEEDKMKESKPLPNQAAAASTSAPAQTDNGNAVTTGDLLGFGTSQPDEANAPPKEAAAQNSTPAADHTPTPNNGNVTADLLGLSDQNNSEDKPQEQTVTNKQQMVDISPNANTNTPAPETNNGNLQHALQSNVGHISANFIQTERLSAEHNQKIPENIQKLVEDGFSAHNGHGAAHDNTLALIQN